MKSGQFQKKTLQAKAEMTLTLVAWAFVRNLKSQVSPEPQNIKEKQLKQGTTLFLCAQNPIFLGASLFYLLTIKN